MIRPVRRSVSAGKPSTTLSTRLYQIVPFAFLFFSLLVFYIYKNVDTKLFRGNYGEPSEARSANGLPSFRQHAKSRCYLYSGSCDSCVSEGCYFQSVGNGENVCSDSCQIMDTFCYGGPRNLDNNNCPKPKAINTPSGGIPGNCQKWYDGCNNCFRDSINAPAVCTMMHCEHKGVPVCKKYFPDTIPEDCQQWFDGCNHCSRGSVGGAAMCTLMYCEHKSQPFCKVFFQDPEKAPSNCLVWFDGCNMCSRETSSSPFICTEKHCDPEDKKEPQCKKRIEENEKNIFERASEAGFADIDTSEDQNDTSEDKENCKVWFDGCNVCKRSNPSSQFACTLKMCFQQKKPFCKLMFDQDTSLSSKNSDKSSSSMENDDHSHRGIHSDLKFTEKRKWCDSSKQQRCRMMCHEPVCASNECLKREDHCCKFSCQKL